MSPSVAKEDPGGGRAPCGARTPPSCCTAGRRWPSCAAGPDAECDPGPRTTRPCSAGQSPARSAMGGPGPTISLCPDAIASRC
eukprot:5229004-Alexandrium_andersonii.AAC.1